MGSARTLVNVTITDVSDRPLTYVACPICCAKLLDNLFCDKCGRLARERDLSYRYCLVVVVNDASMSANVTVFGSSLNGFLGGIPKQVHALLHECPDASFWLDTLRSCLVGRRVILGIKTLKSSMNPGTTLSTITSKLVNKNENLVATQIFPVSNNDDRTFYKALKAKLSEPVSISSPTSSQIRVKELKSCERTTLRPHYLLSSGHYSALEKSRRSSFLSSLDSFASEKSRGYGVENLESDVSELSTHLTEFTFQDSESTPLSRDTGNSEVTPLSRATDSDGSTCTPLSDNRTRLTDATNSSEGTPLSRATGSSELAFVVAHREHDSYIDEHTADNYRTLEPGYRTRDDSLAECIGNLVNGVDFDQSLWEETVLTLPPTRPVERPNRGFRNHDQEIESERGTRNESASEESERKDAHRFPQTNIDSGKTATMLERTSGRHPLVTVGMSLVSLDETSDSVDCNLSTVVCSLKAVKQVPRYRSTGETLGDSGGRSFQDSESSGKTVKERRTLPSDDVGSPLRNSFPLSGMPDTEDCNNTKEDANTKENVEDPEVNDYSTDFDLAGITFSPWESVEAVEATNGDGSYCGNELKDVPDSENMWEFLEECASAEESQGAKEIVDISERRIEGLSVGEKVRDSINYCLEECDPGTVSESVAYDSIGNDSADMFDCSEELFDASDADDANEIVRDSNSVKSETFSEVMFSQYSPIASQSLFSQSFDSPALLKTTSTPMYESRQLSNKVRRSTNLLRSALESNHSRRNYNASISCEVSGNFSGDLFD